MFVLLGNIYITYQGNFFFGVYFTPNMLLKFDCVYRKSSYKLISFEHNGSVISPSFFRRYQIEDTNRYHDTLVVVAARASDTGIWGCTVEDQIVGNRITVYTEVIYSGWQYT